MKIGGKLCNFIILHCSPSQSPHDSKTFLKNFELNLNAILANNPFFAVTLCNFNVKPSLQCKSGKTSYERSEIEGTTSQFRLQQLIKEPTHHTRNLSSCTEFMFGWEPNLVMESGAHYSLHESSHHQIIYAKFNLKAYYPSPYEREIQNYQKANIANIRKAIDQFPWAMHFKNLMLTRK